MCVQIRVLLQDKHEVLTTGLDRLYAFIAGDGPEVQTEWQRYVRMVRVLPSGNKIHCLLASNCLHASRITN